MSSKIPAYRLKAERKREERKQAWWLFLSSKAKLGYPMSVAEYEEYKQLKGEIK